MANYQTVKETGKKEGNCVCQQLRVILILNIPLWMKCLSLLAIMREGYAIDIGIIQDQYELGAAASAVVRDGISDGDSAFESDIDDLQFNV